MKQLIQNQTATAVATPPLGEKEGIAMRYLLLMAVFVAAVVASAPARAAYDITTAPDFAAIKGCKGGAAKAAREKALGLCKLGCKGDADCKSACEAAVNGRFSALKACPPPAPQAVCGNSKPEKGEGCDDGNRTDGDGCSAVCQTEEPPIVEIAEPPPPPVAAQQTQAEAPPPVDEWRQLVNNRLDALEGVDDDPRFFVNAMIFVWASVGAQLAILALVYLTGGWILRPFMRRRAAKRKKREAAMSAAEKAVLDALGPVMHLSDQVIQLQGAVAQVEADIKALVDAGRYAELDAKKEAKARATSEIAGLQLAMNEPAAKLAAARKAYEEACVNAKAKAKTQWELEELLPPADKVAD